MNARPDPPARELDRLVELAGLGPATLAEFGPELARLAAELEAAFGPEAGLADEIPHRAMGLSDLREDQARERHRAGLWLAEAPERTGDLLRVPPAMGRGEAEGPGPVGPSAAAPTGSALSGRNISEIIWTQTLRNVRAGYPSGATSARRRRAAPRCCR